MIGVIDKIHERLKRERREIIIWQRKKWSIIKKNVNLIKIENEVEKEIKCKNIFWLLSLIATVVKHLYEPLTEFKNKSITIKK